jgi:hypothetical protein
MHRFEWSDDPSVELHLGYGGWIRLLRRNGFEVEDLIELQAKEDSETRYPYVTREWAMRWPSEEVWFAWRLREPTSGFGPRWASDAVSCLRS